MGSQAKTIYICACSTNLMKNKLIDHLLYVSNEHQFMAIKGLIKGGPLAHDPLSHVALHAAMGSITSFVCEFLKSFCLD